MTARAPMYEAPQRPARAAPRPPAKAPPRAPACVDCRYLKSLLAEQREAMMGLAVLACILHGAQRAAWIRARRDAEPLVDMAAERVVLGMLMDAPELALPSDLFAGFTHREFAVAIRTGALAPVLLERGMAGYRRGLRRMAQRCTLNQKRIACEALLAVAERRAAIAAAHRALDALRFWSPPAEAAAELRRALAAIGEAATC